MLIINVSFFLLKKNNLLIFFTVNVFEDVLGKGPMNFFIIIIIGCVDHVARDSVLTCSRLVSARV